MKRSLAQEVFVFGMILGGPLCAAHAQTQTIYEVRGPNGSVYSDKPMPGARAIELPPLNVMDFKSARPATFAPPPPASPARNPESGKAIASGYRSFAIVAPEENSSIIAPSAVFEVRLALEPALLLGEGHAFAVSINGKPVGQRFTASEFMIPPEFWGNTLPPPNQRYQLSAWIVDQEGATLKEAAPVVFTLRNAALRPPAPRTERPSLQAQESDLPSPGQAKPKASQNLLR
jgi:hypothetical protein